MNESSDAAAMRSVCVRAGCNNPAVESDDWDKEYCSNECVATHCRCVEVFFTFCFQQTFTNFFEHNIFCFSEIYSEHGVRSGIRPWEQSNKEQLPPITSAEHQSATVHGRMQNRCSTEKSSVFHCSVSSLIVLYMYCRLLFRTINK